MSKRSDRNNRDITTRRIVFAFDEALELDEQFDAQEQFEEVLMDERDPEYDKRIAQSVQDVKIIRGGEESLAIVQIGDVEVKDVEAETLKDKLSDALDVAITIEEDEIL